MYKIAGELTPCVFHVAARSLGDAGSVDLRRPFRRDERAHDRFRHARGRSVQEAHDLALIAQAATLESRVPIMYFFDGFAPRTRKTRSRSFPTRRSGR
jgi:pyruvate-ferredoxin/flavodoxin oxidoreductase